MQDVQEKGSHTVNLKRFVSVRVCYLDQVEDDDRRAKPLQHLVKMEGSYMRIWVSLVHWKRSQSNCFIFRASGVSGGTCLCGFPPVTPGELELIKFSCLPPWPRLRTRVCPRVLPIAHLILMIVEHQRPDFTMRSTLYDCYETIKWIWCVIT